MVLQALLCAVLVNRGQLQVQPPGALARSWGRGGDAELVLELGWDRQRAPDTGLADLEQAVAAGFPRSCLTPAIARPVLGTTSLHKDFAL